MEKTLMTNRSTTHIPPPSSTLFEDAMTELSTLCKPLSLWNCFLEAPLLPTQRGVAFEDILWITIESSKNAHRPSR